VDYDKNAIDYSYNKIKENGFLSNLEFHRDNAFKFRPSRQYDLIWSADFLIIWMRKLSKCC
jgi:hypothetical protein